MKTLPRWPLFPIVLGLLFAVAYSPFPIPPYLDFQAIYHANLGVLHGIPLYDLTGQVNMIAELANVTVRQVILLPFVYPPWYALLTLPLALLPIAVAARLWFGINVLFLMISVWLVTDDWPAQRRIPSFLLAILFLPVLGALYVGQFVFPVLLGAGILIYALPREKIWLTAIALFLLTFKPHIGGLVFLAVIIHLLLKRNPFARRALLLTSAILLFFFGASFLVDHAWPVHYFETLFSFRDVSPCEGLCISVPMMVVSFLGLDSGWTLWIAGFIFLALIGWFIGSRPEVWKDARSLIAAGFCITLLSSPYQYNYDYVVLLVPLAVLTSNVRSRVEWFLLMLAYFLPWGGLLFGRQGNAVLLISAFWLLLLLWLRRGFLDVYPQAMYNQ